MFDADLGTEPSFTRLSRTVVIEPALVHAAENATKVLSPVTEPLSPEALAAIARAGASPPRSGSRARAVATRAALVLGGALLFALGLLGGGLVFR